MSARGKRWGAAALVLCIILLGAPARAHDAHKVVRVGYFEMDGYHMLDENGARSGYGYDFLQLVARYCNMRFEYVGYERGWDEMQRMLISGEIDLLTSASKTQAREKVFGFSDTMIGTSTAILTVKAGESRYADGDYSGMRVGLVKDSTRNAQLESFMKERGFAYTPVYFERMDDLTRALQEGTQIDAAMTSNLRWTPNEWTLMELGSSPFYAVTRIGDTALLDEVNAAIARMDADAAGWRTRLFNKYYSMGEGEVVAFSAAERAYLEQLGREGRALTVVMNPDCAPYSYFEGDAPKGIVADIFAEVARRMGVTYEMLRPADRAEYYQMCLDGTADVILDAMDDFYTVESKGLEITDPYYTAPLAMLTGRASAKEATRLAQPEVSLLNERYFERVFAGRTVEKEACATFADAAWRVRRGAADGSLMPYYCAEWLAADDETGALKCLMLSGMERAFVYAVRQDEDYLLLSALDKAAGSLSQDFVNALVTANTAHPRNMTFMRIVYQNLPLAAALAALFLAMVAAALFFAGKSRRAQREVLRARRLERYIGYLCDTYSKVLEIDLERRTRRQYMKRGGAVEIEERSDFTTFDIESVHPDDRDACRAVFDMGAVRVLFDSPEDEKYVESRMKSEDGKYRWYSFLLKRIPRDAEHPMSAMLLIKDVDDLRREREQSHAALLGALDAANTASRSKSTFLSSMSHEIRTPLNAMIGYMTIAAASIDNREKVLHCVDSAGVAARHLLSIINDVLDISSMESGKMKLARERFDLKELLSGLTTVFYQQCKQKGVRFAISVNALTEEWVVGDAMRVNQILLNLLSNAVKFTDAGGSVELTVVQTSRAAGQVYIRFVVKDTGIGMSEEYLEKLFTPFEQESAKTSRKYGGTGLGMSITMNLVNLMGGKITVKSARGAGSTFAVTLPFGRTEDQGAEPARRDLKELNVLVVDDLANECDYIHALLTRCGVRCESAGGGEEAVRLVAARKDTPGKFDLCIIDWNMPGLNGVETTRLIHEECDPEIPIIIATAYDISEFEEEALAAGAAKIISKPLFQSTLLDLLVTVYGKYDVKAAEAAEIPDLGGMRVLLAEDNETNVEVAVDILELAGVESDVARNGQEAVELFFADPDRYDAILMDVQMPVMDGYAATRVIRDSGRRRAQTVPIIAITADAFAENVAAALAAGMNGHVAKPIETEVLYRTLAALARRPASA